MSKVATGEFVIPASGDASYWTDIQCDTVGRITWTFDAERSTKPSRERYIHTKALHYHPRLWVAPRLAWTESYRPRSVTHGKP